MEGLVMAFQLTKFWTHFVHYSVRYEAKGSAGTEPNSRLLFETFSFVSHAVVDEMSPKLGQLKSHNKAFHLIFFFLSQLDTWESFQSLGNLVGGSGQQNP